MGNLGCYVIKSDLPPTMTDTSEVNSLPNDKFLDRTKLKAFADDKLNIAVMMISLIDRVENTVGRVENPLYLFTEQ